METVEKGYGTRPEAEPEEDADELPKKKKGGPPAPFGDGGRATYTGQGLEPIDDDEEDDARSKKKKVTESARACCYFSSYSQ